MDLVKVGECEAVLGKYDIFSVTGVILTVSANSEMAIHSSPSLIGGEGAMNVSSTTVRHQTIIIADDDGREHAIELTNLVIPCRDGHRITAWSLGPGCWFKVYNHNTRQDVIRSDLAEYLRPVKFHIGLLLVWFAAFATVMWRVGPNELIFWIPILVFFPAVYMAEGIGKFIGGIRASTITKSPQASI